MNGLNLSLIRKSDDLLILTFPRKFRIILGIIVPFFIILYFIDLGRAGFQENMFLYILGLISLAAGFYDEAWIFDRSTQEVRRKIGVLYFHHQKQLPFSEVVSFEMMEFGQRISMWKLKDIRKYKKFARLTINTTSGEKKSIELVDGKYRSKIREKAEEISKFCAKPLKLEEEN